MVVSMTRNDGGPAFPATAEVVESATGFLTTRRIADGGMSLRDYFAGKAMQGMFAADTEGWDCQARSYVTRAKSCYLMADAMLHARDAE